MSQLWLLEAKPFTQEDRTEVATSVAFWLKPGKYIVGKRGHADLPIEEDKSISRKHAEITVPTSGSQPYILLKDTSKYGTWASAGSTFADEERLGSEPVQVAHHHMIKFGYKSPFKLYHQDWVLYLNPSQRQAATAEDLAAVEEAAAATGLPLTDELQDHPGAHVLSLGATPLRIDGPSLLALLRGYPIVGAGWLLEWQQAKVWCNSRPEQAAYPVQLQYCDGGRLKALPGSAALLCAAEQQLLAGHTLLWLAPARNAELQAAAALLGAANSDAAASGRAATAAAKAAGAVVVRGAEGDPVPAAYKKLSWTTPELLIAGMLEGKLDAAVRAAAALHSTPSPTKGRRQGPGSKAPGSSPTSAAKGRGKGRGRGRAPAAEGDEGEEEGNTGSETDAGEEDLSQPHETHHVMAAHAGPHAPLAVEEQQAPVPPAAAAPQAGGRKRRQAEQQQQQQQQQGEEAEEAVHPTPAKRQKRQAAPLTAARSQAAEAAAQRADQGLPAAEGWHLTQHRQQQQLQQQQQEAGAASGSKAQVPQAAPASTAKRAAAAGPERKGQTSAAAAAAAAEGGTAPPTEQPGGESGSEEQLERAAAEGGSVVLYLPLVAAPSPPAARGTGASNTRDSSGPNFKAFRRSGNAAAAAAAAAVRPLVPFADEPYAPDGPVDAGAFLKAEAERRRRSKQADELFTANVKARKAAPLPNADDDTPPKAGAKGRGRGKAGAAAPGQQSMLAFMPSAGRGRGRGRAKAK